MHDCLCLLLPLIKMRQHMTARSPHEKMQKRENKITKVYSVSEGRVIITTASETD